MNGRNHSPDQIIRRLRGAAQLAGQGQDVTAVAKAMEISEATLHPGAGGPGKADGAHARSVGASTGSRVRDVTVGEDRSKVRTQKSPQEVASLRNLAIGALRRGRRTSPRGCAGSGETLPGRSRYWGGSPPHLGPLRELLPSERGSSSSCRSATRVPETASPVPASLRN